MNKEQEKAYRLLKTARGSVDATVAMLENNRYCIDISHQIASVQGLLKKANLLILKQHMNHCVKDAFLEGQGEEKVDELMKVLDKLAKNY